MYDCNLLVPIATAVAVAIAYFALFKYIPAGQFSTTDIPNQAGRVILITGGNAGLGKTSTLELARKGAKVYMASRTESKAVCTSSMSV